MAFPTLEPSDGKGWAHVMWFNCRKAPPATSLMAFSRIADVSQSNASRSSPAWGHMAEGSIHLARNSFQHVQVTRLSPHSQNVHHQLAALIALDPERCVDRV